MIELSGRRWHPNCAVRLVGEPRGAPNDGHGRFIPIGNSGRLISETFPQDKPSFALNKAIVQKSEGDGLEFALSMIRLHGFGRGSRP